MGKKKKPKTGKPRSDSLLSREQESQLEYFLENLGDINSSNIIEQISTPEFAQFFLDRLPPDEPEAVRILLAIKKAFQEKKVQKAVKKAIFRFKQKGVFPPELEFDKGPLIFVKKEEDSESSVHLGPIDGTGSRGIFLVLSHLHKGVEAGMGVVNDEQGITQFFYRKYSKKRMKEVKKLFFSDFHGAVETSLAHGAIILERAYQNSGQSLGQYAGDYLKLRPWILGNVPLLEQAAVYQFIPPDNLSKEDLNASRVERLLGHELMQKWIIDPDKMRPLMEGIQEVKESRILVSEAQKIARIREVKKKAISSIYSEKQSVILKERLEEMAYVFFKRDEEEMAHLCLASAQSLSEGDSPWTDNPFLDGMIECSLGFYEKVAREMNESDSAKDVSSPRIIIP